jgi:hypothetical protein
VKIFFAYAVMLFVVLTSVPIHAQLVLYDNFSGNVLDPSKWVGSESSGSNSGNQGRDVIRRIAVNGLSQGNHALALGYVGYCDNLDDSHDCESVLQLHFTDPTTVTTIQATIKPRQVEATSCSSQPGIPTFISARLYGFFFNSGVVAPPANDHTNDVVARIQVGSDSTNPDLTNLSVNARVFRCTNSDCSNGTDVAQSPQAMGTIALNASTTLTMQWDATANQFIFTRDSLTPVTIPYVLFDDFPPSLDDKRIDVAVDVPSCTASVPHGTIAAFIDDVFVNPEAAPTSAAAPTASALLPE